MTSPPLVHPHNIIKGSLYAIAGFFFMAVFGIFTSIGDQSGDAFWVSFITYAAATLCTTIVIFPQGKGALRSQHYTLLIARAVIGTTASFLYMISMRYIPIVNSTLLFNTAPIFIPLLSILWLKISIPENIWFAVILGFIGICIIIKPGTDIFRDPGNLIGLAAGIALAIAYLIMKILTNTETGLRIIFYYFFIGMMIQIPLLFFAESLPNQTLLYYSILSGISLFLAQIGLVKAYTFAGASEVGVYQYLSVIFVAVIEWLIWQKSPQFSEIMGFLLVAIAGVIIIHRGLKHE